MTCSKCCNYSFPLRRCLLGKIMPNTIKAAKSAISVMGIDYICGKYPHKIKAYIATLAKN